MLNTSKPEYNPFRLPLQRRWLAGILEKTLGLSPLAAKYETRPKTDGLQLVERSREFLSYTLKVLGAELAPLNPEKLEQIPQQGPLIVVANHPFGGLEGVALTRLLLQHRSDLKVLTNQLLTKIPELNNLFIGVDVLSKNAAKENARGIREAYQHLSTGGVLLIFPAGMVSAININGRNPLNWRIADRPWNTLVGRLVKKFNAPCLPVFIHGRNSDKFYVLGLIHPRLRTALLARELSNKSGIKIKVEIGDLISTRELENLSDENSVTHYLRMATYMLDSETGGGSRKKSITEQQEPIQSCSEQRQKFKDDLKALEDCLLKTQGDFSVYCAPYARLGSLMMAIAQAREVTFRAAGEGTGKSLDSDRFDPFYDHLFVWDNVGNQIVGGYRLGRTDEIVARHGLRNLYSRSLYHFNEDYLRRLGGALEVGRSFVAVEYQKHPRALDMLWQGIGTYVARNRKYHTLFGCVSISREHSELARAFLADSMLESFRAEQEYLSNVRPVAPLKIRGKLWTAEILSSLSDIAVINKLLGRFDSGLTVPILLRQYLNLNGRFVCFSLNKSFNNSLDGLIIVDLRKTPEKYLRRYLGKTGSAEFLAHWREQDSLISVTEKQEQHETAA